MRIMLIRSWEQHKQKGLEDELITPLTIEIAVRLRYKLIFTI